MCWAGFCIGWLYVRIDLYYIVVYGVEGDTMFFPKKAQMNKFLLGVIIFVVLLVILLIFISARKGNLTDLLGALPSGP